ncbi:response regulator [Hugenholtzia roseola]|uniref:response regulator n=1 Tax=Hugenholtzia roseola TaxID=1002 RepID=UPI00041DD7DA|nr:response regulator [Hugenholtzia roseola]
MSKRAGLFQRLSTKLILGFSVILIVSIFVNLFAIWKLYQVQKVAIEISENWMPSIYTISDMNTSTGEFMIQQQQHIFSLSEVEMAQAIGNMEEIQRRILERSQEFERLLSERERRFSNEEMTESVERDKNRFLSYKELYTQYIDESKRIIQLSNYNNKEEAKEKMRERSFSLFESCSMELTALISENFMNGKRAAERSEEIYADSRTLITLFTMLSIFASVFVAFFIVSDVRKQIGGEPADIAEVVRRVSDGDLTMEFRNDAPSNSIYTSVRKMVENLREVSKLTNNIAKGDLSRRVEVKSKADLLAISINQMIDNFKDIITQAQVIAKGDYSINIKQHGEHDELGAALQLMTNSLRQNKQETQEQNWIKDGLNQLGKQLSGNLQFIELSRKAISFLARYTTSSQGVLYIYEGESKSLKLQASFAFTERNALSNQYKIGEGLIGQVALERSPILLKNIRRNDMTLSAGTFEEPPMQLFAFPLVFENELYGVIELASFDEFTTLKRDFLEQASITVATYIYSVQQTDRIKGLLAISEEATRNAEARAREIAQANMRLEVQQAELQEKSEELRRRNESLIQAKEELDRRAEQLEMSNRYKSEFLANMSHELRTPLNSIIMLSKMLSKNERNSLNDKDVKKAKIIHKSGGELLRLINDILDLSKIEAGKMVINPAQFATDEILTDMHDLFHTIAQEKNVAFIIDDQVKGALYTDKERLAQILRNFLANAFKFTKKGSVTLRIAPYQNTENQVVFSVVDTGIGIPKDKQQIIFEAFKQADGTTSREYGGTGLGLSIARELAKLLQGKIELESTPNQGSTFSLVLPLEIDEELAAKEERVTVAKTERPAAEKTEQQHLAQVFNAKNTAERKLQMARIRQHVEDDRNNIHKNDFVILIVEDEVQFAESMAEVLKQQGIKTLIAQSGEEGIDLALEFKPSGIILDLGLPDIDGVDVLRKIKSIKELRHIPIEIISARDKDSNLISRGAIGFLQKPIDELALKNALQDMVKVASKSIKELLIVEDDESQMEAIKALLVGDDVRVLGVRSKEEAINQLQTQHFDGAIIDLGLKDGNGAEICEFINENYPKVPIIIYTGKSISPEEEKKLRKAAQSIVLKAQDAEEKLKDEVSIFLHRMEKEVEQEDSKSGAATLAEVPKETAPAEVLQPIKPNKAAIEEIEAKVAQQTVAPNGLQKGRADTKTEENKDFSREEIAALIKDKNILVVDDDIRNIFVIASALESFEANILEALNGQEAIETLRSEEVDLVLMDSVMPEMNGLDAMRQIRNDPQIGHIAIIAITGKAQEEDKKECLDAGANDYITKPVDYDQLIKAVCQWIGKKV